MGCGQSRIGNIYSKNKKNKNNDSKKSNDSIGSASIDQKNGSGKNRTNNNGIEVNRNEGQNGVDAKNQKKKSGGPGNGPLLHQAEISSSQLDFFRMLDEKIENGPDYDENVDATLRAQRISDLLRRWEVAGSMPWSSVTDLNNASNAAALTSAESRKGAGNSNSLSAKDREGMRNIIGGRPESAPIFMRNANRADGLEDVHCPSPNMPRHVLESISQSPTQTMKNSSSSTASPTGHRFHVYRVYDNLDNTNQMMHNNYRQNQMTNQNDNFVKQQALYREQYLQQTGIISAQSQYQNRNVLRNNAYVQQFPLATNEEHFSERKGNFNNSIELT